jgi:ribonuclease Z
MADRANVRKVVLTHLIPSIGAETFVAFTAPALPLEKGDFRSSVKEGGYNGPIYVGQDIMTARVPDDTQTWSASSED